MNTKTPLILHGEWFDISFPLYLYPDTDELKKYQQKIRDKIFTVTHTNISYRTINHWEQQGLLFDNYNEQRINGWRKFSLVDIVWLNVIKELRDFGLSLDSIKTVKDCITFQKTPQLLFEFYLSCGAMNKDSCLIVTKDGEAGLGIRDEVELTEAMIPFPLSYININITGVLKKLISQDGSVYKNSVLSATDPEIERILISILDENTKEVRITTKDSAINKVEIKKEHRDPRDPLKKIKEISSDGKRKRISIEVQNGKVIAIEEIEKTKRTEKQ